MSLFLLRCVQLIACIGSERLHAHTLQQCWVAADFELILSKCPFPAHSCSPPSTGADTVLSDVTAPTTIAAEALHDHVAAVCNIIMESLCSCDGGGWGKKFLLLPCNNQHAV